MASLIENLIDVLQKENEEYQSLIALSKKKTPVIIAGDLAQLERITDEEQDIVSRIHNLEKFREEVTTDIGNVLNRDVEQLKLGNLIELLQNAPKEQEILRKIHDELKMTMTIISQINSHNEELIRTSLDIVDFNLAVLRSSKAAPQTANYSKYGTDNGYPMGVPLGGFDTKQ